MTCEFVSSVSALIWPVPGHCEHHKYYYKIRSALPLIFFSFCHRCIISPTLGICYHVLVNFPRYKNPPIFHMSVIPLITLLNKLWLVKGMFDIVSCPKTKIGQLFSDVGRKNVLKSVRRTCPENCDRPRWAANKRRI